MTWNPLAAYRDRKAARKQQQARQGKTTSGHLSPGERQRLFRNRKK